MEKRNGSCCKERPEADGENGNLAKFTPPDFIPYSPDTELIFPSALRKHEFRPLALGNKRKKWYRPATLEQLLEIKNIHPFSLTACKHGCIRPSPAQISRFDHIGSALFAGDKMRINDAIQDAIQKENTQAKSMLEIISPELFRVEQPTALAYYSSTSITNHYPEIAEKIVRSPTAGRLALVELINSHLHNTFQNTFPAGIAVLKPFPKYTTALVEPSLRLAKALAQCSTSPMPSSCPPSNQNCQPCSPDKSLVITQPSMYKNTSKLFTIGTLPHPYTLISLQNNTEEVTSRYIRRETERDAWLKEVTSTIADSELGGSSRAVILKEAVAGDFAIGSSLWMTVESLPAEAGQALPSALLDEFEWQLGFKIPRDGNVDQKNEGKAKESMQHANPSEQGIEREYDLLQKARDAIKDKKNNRVHIKDMAEAWNLADTEVWRFVRAYRFVSYCILNKDFC